MAGERTLAVNDDEHLRILGGAGIFVHVTDLPGGAVAVLRGGVFHRIGIGDVILPERLVRIDIRRHAWHAIVLVDELLRPVEARDVIHERDEFWIVLPVIDNREHAVMRDGALFGDQIGSRNSVYGALGKLEVQPLVIGDMHHHRAGSNAPEVCIDVVCFADTITHDEVDRVVQLGALGHAAAGLLIRRVPVEHFRLYGIEALRGAEGEVITGKPQHRPAERDARARMLFLRQIVIVAVGRLPDRIGLDRRRHQLECPVADWILGVRLRRTADRHQRADEFRMHHTPDIGLRATH